MPLIPLLRLNMCALFLFVCSFPISGFQNKWQNCSSVNTCGAFNFSYPFGKLHSGCGDLDFQLACEGHHPLIKIRESEYRILEPYMLGNNSVTHSITIVNDNLWKDKCKLLDNYSQSWWYDYKYFQIARGYTNLTFWRDCNQSSRSYRSNMYQLNLCGNIWYYSFSPEIEKNGTHSCQTRLQLPIKEEVLRSNKPINNQTFEREGFKIQWLVDPFRSQNCGACLKSKGKCGHNTSTTFLCYCRDGTSQPDKCHGVQGLNKSAIIRGKIMISSDSVEVHLQFVSIRFLFRDCQQYFHSIAGCSIGGVVLIAFTAVMFLKVYVKNRKTISRGFVSGLSNQKRNNMEAVELRGLKIGNLPKFSYQELRKATNCFHQDNEVGDGGFGSVYFGNLGDGRSVAVKRLYQDNARRVEQFINELKIFSTLNHPRVVRLYGCAYEDSPELLLVYEFVPNGTLADHLHGHRRGPKGLPWDTRLNIAIQTAEALAFLHSLHPPILHRDVKSSNILLDEDFNVKVADFGLCRLVPDNATHVTTVPQGTPGYVDPEYHQCYQLTEKSDVYSFGVVLLEIISGKLAVDMSRNARDINLANMAITKIQEGALHELVDKQLEIELNHKVKAMVTAAAELAFGCLLSERVERPHMNEIIAQLEKIRQSWIT